MNVNRHSRFWIIVGLAGALGVGFLVAGGGGRLLSDAVSGPGCPQRVQELEKSHKLKEEKLVAEVSRLKAKYLINTGKLDDNEVFQEAYGKYLDSNKRLPEDFGTAPGELAAFDRMADLVRNLQEE